MRNLFRRLLISLAWAMACCGAFAAEALPASDNPALVNTEPYTGGSFFTLRLSNSAEAEALLSAAAYSQQIGA